MNKYSYEFTDTYGGEANYCWVSRGTVEAATDLSAVRKVKAALGLSGHPCKRDGYGDAMVLRPVGSCTVLFINDAE